MEDKKIITTWKLTLTRQTTEFCSDKLSYTYTFKPLPTEYVCEVMHQNSKETISADEFEYMVERLKKIYSVEEMR